MKFLALEINPLSNLVPLHKFMAIASVAITDVSISDKLHWPAIASFSVC